MATAPAWRPLPGSPPAGLPNLLVSTTFSLNAYTIHVTDLANMWVESMDRKAIWRRSLNESTTIDPTDSETNMRAFLSKIRSVFDPSHEDHDKALMTLSTSPNRDAGEGGLTMNITCELDNMKPLEWPMYLAKCPQSKLTTELVLPLAQANSAKTRQVDSLLETIKQKDIVITKLLDKLESTGTRLENVFTALSAKQKPTRKMAEDKVKGLAAFRLDEWKSRLDGNEENVSSLIQSVFGASGLEYHQIEMNNTTLDDWWTKTESSAIAIVGPKSRSRQGQPRSPSPGPKYSESASFEDSSRKPDADDDDDDFQVQSTPPHLVSTRKHTAKPAIVDDDASTEDEDPSQIPDSVPVPPQELKSHPVRLGTIGQKRQSPPARSSPPPPKVSKPAESETESDSDEDATASLTKASSPRHQNEPKPTTRSAKVGLGRIGGGNARPEAPESPKKGVLGRIGGGAHRSKSPEPPKKGGLGRIGGGARPSKTPEPAVAEERGRSRASTKPQEKYRETSQERRERADRKREELEKELQRKAAAGPARKKRKF